MVALDVRALDTTTDDKMLQIRCHRHSENRIGLYVYCARIHEAELSLHWTYNIVAVLAALKWIIRPIAGRLMQIFIGSLVLVGKCFEPCKLLTQYVPAAPLETRKETKSMTKKRETHKRLG